MTSMPDVVMREEMVNSLKYFWEEKGDITRWTGYEKHKHLFPEVVRAYHEFKRMERMYSEEVTRAINELDRLPHD
jgi:hypothetical protein